MRAELQGAFGIRVRGSAEGFDTQRVQQLRRFHGINGGDASKPGVQSLGGVGWWSKW